MVYGPNIGGNIGSMLSGIKKGWFPPLPETGNRKSMVHVRDLIRAMIFVADNKRANKEIYNVTDGFGYSSRNMYTIIRRAQGLSNIRWSVPISVFKNISKINPFIEKKILKIFSDECYSSEKLLNLNFNPKMSLKNINTGFAK
jgi:nucleoside-diphosphate-sugar epimerase